MRAPSFLPGSLPARPGRQVLDVCGRKVRQAVMAMNRTSGVGLTSFGTVLVIVGAILRFAITVHTSGFNIHKVGDILLLVGIMLVILSVGIIAMGSRSRVT